MPWSPEEAGPGLLETTVFKSLALGILTQALREPGKHFVLDLGPPVGDNVRYFSRFHCRLFIDDFVASAGTAMTPEAEGASPSGLGASTVAQFEEVREFDLVLLWDLVDYVSSDVATEIAERLHRICGSGSLLYLLVSTRGEIPARPGRFRIFDDSHVAYEPASGPVRSGPGHTPRELERVMHGFQMLHSFLIGNGLQEYLFTST